MGLLRHASLSVLLFLALRFVALAFRACQDETSYYDGSQFDYLALSVLTGSRAKHTMLDWSWSERRFGRNSTDMMQLELILGAADLPTRATVVEFGPGLGIHLAALARDHPTWSIHGIESNARHLARSRDAVAAFDNVRLHADVPVLDRVDLLFGIESMCHLDTDATRARTLDRLHPRILAMVDGFRVSEDVHDVASTVGIGVWPTKGDWRRVAASRGLWPRLDRSLTERARPFWKFLQKLAIPLSHVPFWPRHTWANLRLALLFEDALSTGDYTYDLCVFSRTSLRSSHTDEL